MFYITTSIPYTNGKPHFGTLFDHVLSDTFARFYRRVMTDGVWLEAGADQNGLKNYEKALQLGLTPQEFVNQNTSLLKSTWAKMNVNYDVFVETSHPNHHTIAQLVWKKLTQKDLIYKKKYRGLYCKGCEEFKTDSQIVDGRCIIHPHLDLVELDETNYFFRLSKFESDLLEFLDKVEVNPSHVTKEQRNFVQDGLKDVSFSREKTKLPWGVPVPDDQNQTMYIWFEALVSYLTALIDLDLVEEYQINPNLRPVLEEEIWNIWRERLPVNLMVMGIDNAKFHLVIWPAILKALDLPLPEKALVHGFINDNQGRKFSKSLDNAIEIDDFVAKLGVDGVRFWIQHQANITGDTNFDWKQAIEAYNANLANNLGNMVNRVANLAEKYLNEIDPTEKSDQFDFSSVYANIHTLNLRAAWDGVLKACDQVNLLVDQSKPWELAKNGQTKDLEQLLTRLCKMVLEIGQVVSIFLPETGEKIVKTFSQPKITKPSPLFPRVEL
jgi:methionyl-tRNA synthetase